MEAEELLLYLKDCVEGVDEDDNEISVLPTKGDPTKPQNKVSFIIMEKVKEGRIPRFIIHVEDLEAMRKEKDEL
jgi:hypothetical protein